MTEVCSLLEKSLEMNSTLLLVAMSIIDTLRDGLNSTVLKIVVSIINTVFFCIFE